MLFAGVTWCLFFFFQAEDGIRDLVRSRGLGDVYKRQLPGEDGSLGAEVEDAMEAGGGLGAGSGVPNIVILSLIHI